MYVNICLESIYCTGITSKFECPVRMISPSKDTIGLTNELFTQRVSPSTLMLELDFTKRVALTRNYQSNSYGQ